MKNVEDFLRRFHSSKNIDEIFVEDCSYWFAAIIFGRFIRDGAKIMYDEASNRFATKVKDRVYDITGDVTDKHNWIQWESITDISLKTRIINENIMF